MLSDKLVTECSSLLSNLAYDGNNYVKNYKIL